MIEATESTFRQILKTHPTCLVDFSASWCAPCHQMAPILRQLEQSSKITVIKVDVERCPNLAKEFDIQAVPTFVFFKKGLGDRREQGVRRLAELQILVSS